MIRNKLIIHPKNYVIFDNHSKFFSYDKLRHHLNKYNLNESKINYGIESKLYFLWFKYISICDIKIIKKYLNIPTIIINNILGVESITNKYILYLNLEKYFKNELDFISKTQLFTKDLFLIIISKY